MQTAWFRCESQRVWWLLPPPAPGSRGQLPAQLLAPRSRSAVFYLWREVCVSSEQAQGEQLRVPSIILEIFHLFWEK